MAGYLADLDAAFAEIRERMLKVPNVLAEPEPEIGILSFDDRSFRVTVRPFTHHDNYYQVQAAATTALLGVLEAAGPKIGELIEEGEEGALEAAEAEGAEEAAEGEGAGHEEAGEAKEEE